MKTKNIVFSNVIWRLAERFGAQLIVFVVSIVLARLLTPEDYGTIALITIFINLLNVFVDSGFGTALIQKKNVDNLDYSSVFYFNIFVCLFLYCCIFFAAPIISSFYSNSFLTPIIRVLSFSIVISGLKNVLQAYVSRNMLFKRFFFATLGGTIGAAIIGIFLAYKGAGVWALVLQHIFNILVDTVILWITVDWRPILSFSFIRLRELFCYGWKLLVSALINTSYVELKQLVIGKVYNPIDLAFYNQGDKIPKFITMNINTSIDSVLLPVMADMQDYPDKVKNMMRQSIKISVFILAPIMLGIATLADKLVLIILTEKWLPCVPYMRVFCIILMFYPIHTCNLNAIKAMGRSDLFLKLEILKTVIGIVVIFITMNISVWAMCVSGLVTTVLTQIINAWPNKKLLNYCYLEQIKDILPCIIVSVGMSIIVYCIGFITLDFYVSIFLQVLVGICIYIVGSRLFNSSPLEYVIDIFRSFKANKIL